MPAGQVLPARRAAELKQFGQNGDRRTIRENQAQTVDFEHPSAGGVWVAGKWFSRSTNRARLIGLRQDAPAPMACGVVDQ